LLYSELSAIQYKTLDPLKFLLMPTPTPPNAS
jgi:hypothetical protein